MERTGGCNKVCEDVVRLIYLYLGKYEFLRHFIVTKTRLPCLLGSSLAYIFSGVLILIDAMCKQCF